MTLCLKVILVFSINSPSTHSMFSGRLAASVERISDSLEVTFAVDKNTISNYLFFKTYILTLLSIALMPHGHSCWHQPKS